MIVGGIVSKQMSVTDPGSVNILTTVTSNNLIFRFSWEEIYWDEVANNEANTIYEDILASFEFL